MFNFTPLLGAQSGTSGSQSLLELDGGVKVLIDIGWDESFDVEQLRSLEKHVPTLSIILLTHATVAHLAAYAHCCKHFPLFSRIPIYATTPVISLGRTLVQDLYAATPLSATAIPASSLSEIAYPYSTSDASTKYLLQAPTAEEIATYFALIHPLKYSQPHQPLPSAFSPPLNGLTVTAYNAGHTLGGTIWHIQHGLESIVYAVDWNQAKENTLASAAWLGGVGAGGTEVIEQLRKPTALICSTRGAERIALAGGRSKRDESLLESIKSVVVKGGTVLIPTDTSARVLELAYLLEHAWRKASSEENNDLANAGLYLANKNIGTTMRLTRSMLEWMDDSIVREFESATGGTGSQKEKKQGLGPFDFKHLQLIERQGQITRLLNSTSLSDSPSKGKVILASDTSLEWGFSRDILHRIGSDSKNLVILTERSSAIPSKFDHTGIARTLFSWWDERRDGVAVEKGLSDDSPAQVYSGGRDLVFRDVKRVALEGHELTVYQQWLGTQRQLQTTLQSGGATALETSADVVDDASSESSTDSEDSETEQQGKALNMATTLGQANRKKVGISDEDLGINILLRRKGVYDYDVRGKKGREKMFPLIIRRRRADEFGDLIRPEDYLRAEERDEVDGIDMRQVGKNEDEPLGKKRKWDDVAGSADRRLSNGGNKRQQTDNSNPMTNGENTTTPLLEEMALDEVEAEIIGPAKISTTTSTLTMNLRLAFIDFAGVHDKRSLQMLIPLIQPRKLILVRGSNDETESLAEDCRKLLASQAGGEDKSVEVYTPTDGTVVDASVDTNAWTVKLTDSLVKRLRWQTVKGLGIVTLTGQLAAAVATSVVADEVEREGDAKKLKLLEGSADATSESAALALLAPKPESLLPTLDLVPTSMASSTRSVAQPLHVGDLRLADLRKLMLLSGYTAEFRGEGTLLIDGSVAVRKMSTGRIEVESVGFGIPGSAMLRPGEAGTFYAVKSKIYEGLAVVAGG